MAEIEVTVHTVVAIWSHNIPVRFRSPVITQGERILTVVAPLSHLLFALIASHSHFSGNSSIGGIRTRVFQMICLQEGIQAMCFRLIADLTLMVTVDAEVESSFILVAHHTCYGSGKSASMSKERTR